MKKAIRKIHKKAKRICQQNPNYAEYNQLRKNCYIEWQSADERDFNKLRWYILYNKYSAYTAYVTKEEKQTTKMIIKSLNDNPPDVLKAALSFFSEIEIDKNGNLVPDSFDTKKYSTENIANAENVIKTFQCYDAAFYVLAYA